MRDAMLANTYRIRDCASRSRSLSGEVERFRQLDRAEHVCDALQVIRHRRETNFDLCTGQPAHQQTRMSEDSAVGDAKDSVKETFQRR